MTNTSPDKQNATKPIELYSVLFSMGAVYAAFCWFYNTPSLSEPRLYRELFLWPAVLILGWLYWRGYQLLSKTDLNTSKSLWLSIGAILGLALLTPPFHSTDVFGYINRGWEQVHYHVNPYVTVVDELPNWKADPMLTSHWTNNPSPYGFLFMHLTRWLCELGQGSKALTVFWFKLLNVGLMLGSLTILSQVSKAKEAIADTEPSNSTSSSTWQQNLYLFGLNPLLLIHQVINGHNDLIMGFFILLALIFALTKKWLWVLPLLMAATLIKYAALILMPLTLIWMWQNKQRNAILPSLLITTLLVAISGYHYLGDWQQFKLFEIQRNAQVTHGSLHAMLFHIGETLLTVLNQPDEIKLALRSLLKYGLIGGFLISYGWLCKSLWQQGKPSDGQPIQTEKQLIISWTLAMFLLVCVVSLKHYPWYYGMFLPLIFLLNGSHPLRQLILILTVSNLLTLTVIGQAHILNYLLITLLPMLWLLKKHPKMQDWLNESQPR